MPGLGPVCRHGCSVACRIAIVYSYEFTFNPAIASLGVNGGNMDGKEVRFGIAQSALFAAATTATSDGAVNAMHDSFMPLSGLVLMANMMLDEVVVGGPGSGLFGILLFVIVAVFMAGLMIGRTPKTADYLEDSAYKKCDEQRSVGRQGAR